MRHAIARYLFIAGVVASLGLAACSTNGGTPLPLGGFPNGSGGTNGVGFPITVGSQTTPPNPSPTPTASPTPVPSPKGT